MILKIKEANLLIKNKWLVLFVFLIFMALSAEVIEYVRIANGVNPTFFETILVQTNEQQMILFPLLYVLLLFSQDKNVGIKNEQMPIQMLQSAFVSTALYIGMFIIANLLYCIIMLGIDGTFNNIWSFVSEFIYIHMSPLAATSISILLLFLRFSFTLFLISFINTLIRTSHWGFWIAFLISYIDFMFYNFFKIRDPWGILPIEHTRIIYTEAYIPNSTATRISYFSSILYWIGLFVVVFFALVLIYKRRKNEKNIYR